MGRLTWYLKGQFSARMGKGSSLQGTAKLLQNVWERDRGMRRHPPGEPKPKRQKHQGRNQRPCGKAEAGQQYLISTCPVSAEEVVSAEPTYLYVVISMDRQFRAALTGAEHNAVQLPVKPCAGKNDL